MVETGELIVERDQSPRISGVINQSTGYCPEPDCWGAVRSASGRLGVEVPGGFTPPSSFGA